MEVCFCFEGLVKGVGKNSSSPSVHGCLRSEVTTKVDENVVEGSSKGEGA